MRQEVAVDDRALSPWPDLAVIWLFTLALPTVTSAILVLRGLPPIVFTDRRLIGSVLIEVAGLFAVAAWLKGRGLLRSVPSIAPSWGGTGRAFGLLVSAWVLYFLCAWLMVWGSEAGLRLDHVSITVTASLPSILAMCVLNPVFEELIVVGCVQRALEGKGAFITIGGSAALRVAYHLYQGSTAVAFTLPLGILFAAYYWRKRDLWPLIVAHGLQDFLGMMAHQ